MAHTCPVCGSYCTCGGDIDDMDLGMVPVHCECCVDDDEDYGFDEDDDNDYL